MNILRKLTNTSLILIFLVILAGSIVRMSGSGMGCPDWPKCFGYLIPPTQKKQVSWQENRLFVAGQMIIKNEQLLVAKHSFKSDKQFNSANWQVYDKHNYASFKVHHTWIEYINRLIGALSGIPILLLFIFSIVYRNQAPSIKWFSFFTLIMLGFEAWLGKKVVDGNLIPGQISLHMFGAICIVTLLIIQKVKLSPTSIRIPQPLKALTILAMLFSLVQIYLGVQVREEVDVLLNGTERSMVVEQLSHAFEWHRIFALSVILLHAALLYFNHQTIQLFWYKIMAGVVLLEFTLGIGLSYLNLTPWMQPLHLCLAILLFGIQCFVVLKHSIKPAKAFS